MGIYKMSDIFLKNKKKAGNVSEFLDTESVTTASLPQWLSVVDVPQKGGDQKDASSDTSTTELENKLRKIFNEAEQTGGKKRRKSKKVSVTEDGKKKKKASKRNLVKNHLKRNLVKKLKELLKRNLVKKLKNHLTKNLPKKNLKKDPKR